MLFRLILVAFLCGMLALAKPQSPSVSIEASTPVPATSPEPYTELSSDESANQTIDANTEIYVASLSISIEEALTANGYTEFADYIHELGLEYLLTNPGSMIFLILYPATYH